MLWQQKSKSSMLLKKKKSYVFSKIHWYKDVKALMSMAFPHPVETHVTIILNCSQLERKHI